VVKYTETSIKIGKPDLKIGSGLKSRQIVG
jgi:hypothetical protein